MIYITSDLHFCHDRDFVYEPRGFTSIEEMNETIIQKWNELITSEDTVYILGDLMLNDNLKGLNCLNRLNGKIKILFGNHDTNSRQELYVNCTDFYLLDYADVIKYKGYTFYLSHYPTLTSNLDADKPLKKRVINLCGHTHTKDKWEDWDKGLIYHCELDAHDCLPVSLDKIIEEIKERVNESSNRT